MSDSSARKQDESLVRPDIFRHHDYRAFLKEWFAYLKKNYDDFSIRAIAQQAKLASGYLPMVLAGDRNLTLKTLDRILPFLRLNRSEQSYLESLVRLSVASGSQGKVIALDRMAKSAAYRKRNPQEAEFFVYMSHWYYIAIREMAALPDFNPDPQWIQERLRSKVSLNEIRSALDFLIEHGYLKLSKDGSAAPPKGSLTCKGAVYWPALTEYHKQMFSLAAESIEAAASPERTLEGYTVSMSQKRFEEAKKILNEALEKIVALETGDPEPADGVYHVELALFPMTGDSKKGSKK